MILPTKKERKMPMKTSPADSNLGLISESQEHLKRLRSKYGLTWQEVANIFGVSRRTIHNWLNGTPINERVKSRIAKADVLLGFYLHETREATRIALMQTIPGLTSQFAQSPQQALSPYRHCLLAIRGADGLIGKDAGYE